MQRNILFLLMSMVVLSPMAIDIFLSSMPKMSVELNASGSQIQSTISLFFFAMGLGQLAVGPLADRFGRRVIAIAGLFFYCLSAIGASLANDILYLQVFRVLQGLASCAISVVIFSVVRDVYSYERSSKVYSYLNGVLSVIPALAPIFGSFLALSFGWRSTFVFMFGYALLVLVVVAKYFPETLKDQDRQASLQHSLYSLQRFKKVLASQRFIYYACCSMAGLAGILSYVSYAPIWLIQHLEVSELVFSGLFGVNALISIIGCFMAPRWITLYGNRFMVKLGLSLMTLSAVLLSGLFVFEWSGLLGAISFMLPVALLSVGLSVSIGPASSIALSEFAGSAGTASALLGFIQLAGASVVIALVQQTGLFAPVAVSVIVFVLVLPLLLVMSLKRFTHWNSELS